MFQAKVVERIKTHILCAVTFPEYLTVCEIMWKNVVAGQVTEYNTAHAHCMLQT